MAPWHLEVLGKAALTSADKTFHLERKTAALLTYVALEGPTPRSKLAGLLWPDSSESTARGNLRQLLSRLKKTTTAELVTADDPLNLQGLGVDAAKLKVLAFADSDEVLGLTGTLLSPHDYDDCPDFADWLFSERERIALLRQNALNSKIKTLGESANYSEALRYAETLLMLEPLSEETHRQLMRLHYLAGDRAAALAAFELCKQTLHKELGVEPLPETLKLVSEIEFGALLPTAIANKQKADLPLRVLRPPFVGREEAWQRMNEAWQNHQAILLSGVPGVGKSRLMQEFVLASGKPHCLFEARLGDANVPYATNTRDFRKLLAEFPVTLDDALRRELARILSELGSVPAPITNENELVRFYEAQEKTMRLAMEKGLAAVAYDDVQYIDAASVQGWLHTSSNHLGKEDGLRLIASFRKGELPPETQKMIEQLVASGLGVLIELEPLPEQDVGKLIDNLGITDLQPLAQQLSRYTGGNPLFIIETIKHLIESEQLGSETFALPTTGKVFALLKDRLGRLSSEAQRLVWTAAISQSEFSLGLASSILAKSPFELAEPFEELETTNIFSGLRFSHDLLFETALTTIPSPIKTYIHRRCAEELEKTQAGPATIAEHWLGAGDEEKVVPFLVKAAELASSNFQLLDAAKIYERVANILEMKDKPDEAFDHLGSAVQKLSGSNSYEQCERLIQHMFRLAYTNEQLAASFHVRSEHYVHHIRDSIAAEADAREGLKYAETPKIKSFLLGDLSISLWQQDRLAEAVGPLREAIKIQEEYQLDNLAESLGNLSVVVQHLGHYHEALELQKQTIDLLRQRSGNEVLGQSLSNYAITLSELGYVKQSLAPLQEALELQRKMQGVELQISLTLITLGQAQRDLCQFQSALESATEAFSICEQSSDSRFSYYAANLAHIYLLLGQREMSRVLLGKATDNLIDIPSLQAIVLREEARCFIHEGQLGEALSILETAKQKLTSGKRQLSLDVLDLLRADILQSDKSLEIAMQVLGHAREGELKGGVAIGALVCCAKSLLKLKRNKEALEHSQEAVELLKTYDGDMIYLGEVFYTHCQVLETCKSKSAKGYLEQTHTWLLDIANNNVPPEYRDSFLNNNPTNKAILDAAKAAGLLKPKVAAKS